MKIFNHIKTLQFLFFVTFLMCLAQRAQAVPRINLNGEWQFAIDPNKNGEQAGWNAKPPEQTESVRVPHTWNIGKHEDFEGTAWYFKNFECAANTSSGRTEIHFGATFYKSKVWLNGALVGEHEGGHAAYYFDITGKLRDGANFIAVEINNQPTAQTIPGLSLKLQNSKNLWYDWWHYGGIVRDVWLESGSIRVRRQQIQTNLQGTTANVTTRVFLENNIQPFDVEVAVEAFAPDGTLVATAKQNIALKSGKQDLTLNLQIQNAKLWHFDDPQVYQLKTSVANERGNRFDSIIDNFGARTMEIRNRKLYLNGEQIRLTGMTRHQESPTEGLAETAGTWRRDYDDMKRLNVTLTRPVHYQQPPEIFDYADRAGMLLIPEIPIWQFSEAQLTDPKVLALAEQMMRELIEQNYNHPAIFAWSMCNESATDTPGGIAYFRRMRDFAKSIDATRFVTFADEINVEKKTASVDVDFVMMNEYYGAWHGPADRLKAALDRVNQNYPDKMVIISEFGTPGVFARDSKGADELRSRIIREQLQEFGTREWIAGAIFWCYQDYRSHRNLFPGLTAGYVDHGVVDENRQRRPSYAVWTNENAPARIEINWTIGKDAQPSGFRATVERRRPNEIPSYAPRDFRLLWELRDEDNTLVASNVKTLAALDETQIIQETWQTAKTRSLRLRVKLRRPNEFQAAEKTLDWLETRVGGEEIKDMQRKNTLLSPLPPLK